MAAVLAVRPVGELALAMLEDTYEVVAGLDRAAPALALCPPVPPGIEGLTWPGTPVMQLPAESAAHSPGELVGAVLDWLGGLGADHGTVVAADAPDLPPLLLGKLFRALGTAEVSVCPAAGGGLVALAASLPPPPWLAGADVGLDTPDALDRLAAAAPRRRSLGIGPGWHRIRTPDDVAALDPGLEGWDATRALLGGWRG
jgi:hypothetical protein